MVSAKHEWGRDCSRVEANSARELTPSTGCRGLLETQVQTHQPMLLAA